MNLDDPEATRRILIIGATGSIGTQAVEVIEAAAPGGPRLEIAGLAAGVSWGSVCEIGARHGDVPICFVDPAAAEAARTSGYAGPVLADVPALIDQTQPDIVLNAAVGFGGFPYTVAALDRGIPVALANKESLVAGGPACRARAERAEVPIIPVDSEHSALLQCLAGARRSEVASLVLTASGGPFVGRTREELAAARVEEALRHPTWEMGGKITIDSATLYNKALELIEAMVLFDVEADDVEVVIHRHSIVHALSRHVDGSLLAHLGWPDMRAPISYALHWPYRVGVAARRLELTQMPALEFEEPDLEAFPSLAHARRAALDGPVACCVLNAANEVAVDAFLRGQIQFTGIFELVEELTFSALPTADMSDPADVAEVDAWAREEASSRLAGTARA